MRISGLIVAIAAASCALVPSAAQELTEMSRDELIAALGEAEKNREECYESQAGTVESLGDSVKDSAWLLVNVFCREETVNMDALIEMIDIVSSGPSIVDQMNTEWINMVNAAELITKIRLDGRD